MNELDAEDAVQAFQRFTGGSESLATPAVFLVARGDLKLYTDTYTIPEGLPNKELVERHNSLEHMSSSEGDRHLRTKLRAASYLESKGFEVPKKAGSPLEYDCFERYAGNLNSDVVAESETGIIAFEVGYIEPRYLNRAFGFTKLCSSYDVESLKEEFLREEDTGVSHFMTAPYREQSSGEFCCYIFERTDEMAEVENVTGRVADKIDEILDSRYD